MTGDIVEFIKARVGEDERMARAATQAPWWHNPEKQWLGAEAFEKYDLSKGEEYVGYGESPLSGCIASTGPASHKQSMADARHIARHDPARVLREVEAKRALLAEHSPRMVLVMNGDGTGGHLLHCGRCSPSDPNHRQRHPCASLRLLALPYADHPDYRAEWRP